jgi:hypothetical protein
MNRNVILVAATVLLNACGGGGSTADSVTSNSVSTSPPVSGLYQVQTSENLNRDFLLMDDGSIWAIATDSQLDPSLAQEVVHGVATRTAEALVGNGIASYKGVRRTGSLTATSGPLGVASRESYAAVLGFNNIVLSPSTVVSSNWSALASTSYNYSRAADIQEVVGNWTGSVLENFSTYRLNTTFSITAGGTINSIFQAAPFLCQATGTITPNASQKNVFNVNLTFTSTNGCPRVGETLSGIALSYLRSGGERQFVLALDDGVRPYAFLARR